MGVHTGVDLDMVVSVGEWISKELGRKNASRAGSALAARARRDKDSQVTSEKQAPSIDPTGSTKNSLIEAMKAAEAQTDKSFVISRHGSTALITLNRSKNGNALTLEMITGFKRPLNLFLKTLQSTQSHSVPTANISVPEWTLASLRMQVMVPIPYEMMARLFETIDKCPKTTVALVNGSSWGGGVGLAFVCDIRITLNESLHFNLPEVKRGFSPATISKYIVREWRPSPRSRGHA